MRWYGNVGSATEANALTVALRRCAYIHTAKYNGDALKMLRSHCFCCSSYLCLAVFSFLGPPPI